MPSVPNYQRYRHWIILCLILLGFGIRAVQSARGAMWVDEAESSINALTILDTGLPLNEYQGLPIFENTLVQEWPDHPEYEFRDTSYSARGVAVYHSWLPLYSIAGAMAVFGFEPDAPQLTPTPQYHPEDMLTRVMVPRIPAVLAGTVFIGLIYFWGRRYIGEVAALTTAFYATLSYPLVLYGAQARYYGFTVLFSAAAGLAAWQLLRRPSGKNAVLFGAALALLFHSHMLSCLVVCALTACAWPFLPKRGRTFRFGIVSAVILAAAAVPWLLYTGFFTHLEHIPKSWELMDLPKDLLAYPLKAAQFLVPVFVLLLILPWAARRDPTIAQKKQIVYFLSAWGILTYLLFALTIPAASFFLDRLRLMIMVPYSLLFGMCCWVIARLFFQSRELISSLALAGAFLVLTNQLYFMRIKDYRPIRASEYDGLLAYLHSQEFAPGTRVYSTPNNHLLLTYLTGMPVQSIAPVRKEFLAQSDAPMVLIFSVIMPKWTMPLLRKEARRLGLQLNDDELRDLRNRLNENLIDEAEPVLNLDPEREIRPIPPEYAPMLTVARYHLTLESERLELVSRSILPLRDYRIRDYEQWWQKFFYRFVNPDQRSGKSANFIERFSKRKMQFIHDCRIMSQDTCLVIRSDPGALLQQVEEQTEQEVSPEGEMRS